MEELEAWVSRYVIVPTTAVRGSPIGYRGSPRSSRKRRESCLSFSTLYCSLPALFVWVVLENLLFFMELYNKGKNGPCKTVVCVISQEIPDPRQCQSASKELSLRFVKSLHWETTVRASLRNLVLWWLVSSESEVWSGEGDDGVPSSAKGRRYGLRLPLGIVSVK